MVRVKLEITEEKFDMLTRHIIQEPGEIINY